MSFFKELNEKMQSPEGIAEIERYVKNLKQHDVILDKQLQRFHTKMINEKVFKEFVDKVIDKYDSDEYYYRHMNQGFVPPRDLEHFLYKYAVKFGTEIENGTFDIYGWKFEIMYGQGSVVFMDKL